ncbi:hypothetical protein [Parapedobacter lycopersici]|uniref:hypothetical protein n=1 Tax=Parapedobacter lycopersici TaxID=1864939 RepID=UPI00214D7C2F|nr:hypothetical protein [Parapedobacter lycopersici]
MKISLNEWQQRENCLLGNASGEQQALFEARQLLDLEFREAVHWQRAAYTAIRACGRTQLRGELKQIHQTLFTTLEHRTFAEKIRAFFRK